ncbi:MAG TPA: hypothetical protein PK687_05485, partial [Candidatus Avimonas sp.]|nr:hypothetical protein [Candidatus Avimonas sp.]
TYNLRTNDIGTDYYGADNNSAYNISTGTYNLRTNDIGTDYYGADNNSAYNISTDYIFPDDNCTGRTIRTCRTGSAIRDLSKL